VRPHLAALARDWPTPMVSDVERGSGTYMRGNPTLKGAAHGWATPTTRDWKDTGAAVERGDVPENALLGRQVARWPTPTSMDSRSSGSAGYATTETHSAGVTLTDRAVRGLRGPTTATDGASTSTAGRVLNPRFVEALMGWPIGWTDCASWETESSPTRRPSPSESSGTADSMRETEAA
jgi:hypothetical protein